MKLILFFCTLYIFKNVFSIVKDIKLQIIMILLDSLDYTIMCFYFQEEGTLIGSAFAVCFMYWFGASGLVWFVAYVSEVRIAILQILSMLVRNY